MIKQNSTEINNMTSMEMNNNQKNEIIIENILKMLINRKLINEKSFDNLKNKILSKLEDELFFQIMLDEPNEIYGKSVYVNFINQNITTFSKSSSLYTFLQNNNDKYIILITNDITSKSEESIKSKFSNIEIFKKKYFKINLVDHELVPKHVLLNLKETENFLKEYNVTKRQMPKIFVTDQVARYYNAKSGMVFQIHQYSQLSGYNVTYRFCI